MLFMLIIIASLTVNTLWPKAGRYFTGLVKLAYLVISLMMITPAILMNCWDSQKLNHWIIRYSTIVYFSAILVIYLLVNMSSIMNANLLDTIFCISFIAFLLDDDSIIVKATKKSFNPLNKHA